MPVGMGIHIEIKGWPAAKPADLARVTQDGMNAAAQYWHRMDLPKHFAGGAQSRYGYRPRTKLYQLRKSKAQGHQNPLVFSGEMKNELERRAQIRRHKTGVDLKMHARALNFSGKAVKRAAGQQFFGPATYPNMKGEVTAIHETEEVNLARLARKVATKSMMQIRAVRRKTV